MNMNISPTIYILNIWPFIYLLYFVMDILASSVLFIDVVEYDRPGFEVCHSWHNFEVSGETVAQL
jgi:hypothetical protein